MDLRPRTLAGAHVRLEPVTPAHHDEMRAALDGDPENWAIQLMCARAEHWPGYWEAMLGSPGRIAYAVRDLTFGGLAGTSSFLHIGPRHATCEIGSTWLRPEFRGGVVNPEAKLLMLGEAFASGAERVGFRVDARNARSQAAVAKLGAVREGVARGDLVTWTGHRRDTAMFSVLAGEWPGVRAGLEERLAEAEPSVLAAAQPVIPA